MDLVKKYLGEARAKHDKRDKVDIWRAGSIQTWAAAFNDWLDTGERITIKPNVSVKSIEKKLTKERKVKVKLYIPDM